MGGYNLIICLEMLVRYWVSGFPQKHGRVMENWLFLTDNFSVPYLGVMAALPLSSMSMDTVRDLFDLAWLSSLFICGSYIWVFISSMSGIVTRSFGLKLHCCFLALWVVARFQLRGLVGILKAGAYFWARTSILASMEIFDFLRVWLEAFDVSWVVFDTWRDIAWYRLTSFEFLALDSFWAFWIFLEADMSILESSWGI